MLPQSSDPGRQIEDGMWPLGALSFQWVFVFCWGCQRLKLLLLQVSRVLRTQQTPCYVLGFQEGLCRRSYYFPLEMYIHIIYKSILYIYIYIYIYMGV